MVPEGRIPQCNFQQRTWLQWRSTAESWTTITHKILRGWGHHLLLHNSILYTKSWLLRFVLLKDNNNNTLRSFYALNTNGCFNWMLRDAAAATSPTVLWHQSEGGPARCSEGPLCPGTAMAAGFWTCRVTPQSFPLPQPLGRAITALQHSHIQTQETNCSDETHGLKLSTQVVEGAVSFASTANPPAILLQQFHTADVIAIN